MRRAPAKFVWSLIVCGILLPLRAARSMDWRATSEDRRIQKTINPSFLPFSLCGHLGKAQNLLSTPTIVAFRVCPGRATPIQRHNTIKTSHPCACRWLWFELGCLFGLLVLVVVVPKIIAVCASVVPRTTTTRRPCKQKTTRRSKSLGIVGIIRIMGRRRGSMLVHRCLLRTHSNNSRDQKDFQKEKKIPSSDPPCPVMVEHSEEVGTYQFVDDETEPDPTTESESEAQHASLGSTQREGQEQPQEPPPQNSASGGTATTPVAHCSESTVAADSAVVEPHRIPDGPCSVSDSTVHRRRSCLASTSNRPLQNRNRRQVSFSTLQIRSYPVVVGDAPACLVGGYCLSLGWTYCQGPCVAVHEYERHRHRRSMQELRLSPDQRYGRLVETTASKTVRRHACRQWQSRNSAAWKQDFFGTTDPPTTTTTTTVPDS